MRNYYVRIYENIPLARTDVFSFLSEREGKKRNDRNTPPPAPYVYAYILIHGDLKGCELI